MNFAQWLKQTGKSARTVQSYSNAIAGSISSWAKKYGLIEGGLDQIIDVAQFRIISAQIVNNDDFIARNTKGNGMYSAAINQYDNYLSDVSGQDLSEDIKAVLASEIPATEKSLLVNARVGQGKYRSAVIDLWGKCALTGYADTRFLIASHIKPWKGSESSERLDPYNGLLLLPNLDKVFDLGFVTFEDDGDLIISRYLEEPESIGIHRGMKIVMQDPHVKYMAYHRAHVFEKSYT